MRPMFELLDKRAPSDEEGYWSVYGTATIFYAVCFMLMILAWCCTFVCTRTHEWCKWCEEGDGF